MNRKPLSPQPNTRQAPHTQAHRFRRIEQLCYFREWAIVLMHETRDPVYFDMVYLTFKKLRDMKVVLTDVGVTPLD